MLTYAVDQSANVTAWNCTFQKISGGAFATRCLKLLVYEALSYSCMRP